MSSNDSLEALGWVLQLANHGELDITVPHYVTVAFVFAITLWCPGFGLKTWFIEVNIVGHDNGLNAD